MILPVQKGIRGFRFTHELEIFKNSLHIREFYAEKNGHESKIKRDYGNKAYQVSIP